MQKKALLIGLLGVSAGSLAAVTAGVSPLAAPVARILPAAMQSAIVPTPPAAPSYPPPVYVPPAVSSALAQWNSLRQSDNNSFSSYASFLMSHRGWPGEAGLRKSAEKAADPDSGSPGQVVSFFRMFPPLTATGKARYAFALLSIGQAAEARDAAKAAWASGSLSQADESRLLTQFSSALTSEDHDRRIDALLSGGDRAGAVRMLPLASPAMRPLFEARLAMQTNASDAGMKMAALPADAASNAGFLRDKASWLRNTGQANAARQMMANRPPLTVRPTDAEKWYETLLTLAREAANDRQWTTAYDIASKIDDAYAPGTDVSGLSYGERDDYTSLAWLAGSAALTKLGRPADAIRMFERYANAARSQQTRAKGFYWAGRAAAAAGQASESGNYYAQAATAPDQFYGQLAMERLGRSVPPPAQTTVNPTPAERASFANRSLVQAVKALGQMGQWSDQTLFVRALAQAADTDSERALAAELGRSIGRPDLGVWVAREARNKGATFYARPAFPEVTVSPVFSRYWTISHAISRQESSFDRAAVSNAGARGTMQLMPGTARETAGKLGLSYDFSRLTADPSYNMMLGTSYFSTLLDQWGGNFALAVASYNAGSGNVRRWVAQNGDPRMPGVDMVKWIEDIPFSETRNYVQRVLENAVVYDTFAPGGTGTNRLSYYLGKPTPMQAARTEPTASPSLPSSQE